MSNSILNTGKKEFSIKKLFGVIHLWLGVASAIVLFTVCLTGTIFVFHTEIEKLLNPKKFSVKVTGQMIPADLLINKVEAETNGKVVSFQIPANNNEAWVLNIKGKTGKSSEMKTDGMSMTKREEKRGVPYYINPYTGAVNGTGSTGAYKFFRSVEDLHRWFFLGKPVGKAITGTAGLIFIGLFISGIVIWFPKKMKKWKDGFKIKFSAKWKRINYDLHKALGIYVLPIILLCAMTGPAWSFIWYRNTMSRALGGKVLNTQKVIPIMLTPSEIGKVSIPIEKALTISSPYYQGKNITTVILPASKTDVINITKLHAGFAKMSGSDYIQINPYNGTVLKADLFKDKSIGQKLAASFRAIHVGEIFGTFSKIIYFILCLLASSLPVTGIIFWIGKWKKKKRKKVLYPSLNTKNRSHNSERVAIEL